MEMTTKLVAVNSHCVTIFTAQCYAERGYANVFTSCQALHIIHTVSSGVAYDLRAPGYI